MEDNVVTVREIESIWRIWRIQTQRERKRGLKVEKYEIHMIIKFIRINQMWKIWRIQTQRER